MCSRPRQFVRARVYLNQWWIVMRVTWTSVFSNIAEIYSAPSLNAVTRDKKSASVRQADVPTNKNPISPRQKICSSTTKDRLVCGSLNMFCFPLLIIPKSWKWVARKTNILPLAAQTENLDPFYGSKLQQKARSIGSYDWETRSLNGLRLSIVSN